MVDSIVGQANMIRALYGLPERELIEDTSQDEGNFPDYILTCLHKPAIILYFHH